MESDKRHITSDLEVYDKIQKYPVSVLVFSENDVCFDDKFKHFCDACDLIVCNTYDDKLENVKSKVFTRDILSK